MQRWSSGASTTSWTEGKATRQEMLDDLEGMLKGAIDDPRKLSIVSSGESSRLPCGKWKLGVPKHRDESKNVLQDVINVAGPACGVPRGFTDDSKTFSRTLFIADGLQSGSPSKSMLRSKHQPYLPLLCGWSLGPGSRRPARSRRSLDRREARERGRVLEKRENEKREKDIGCGLERLVGGGINAEWDWVKESLTDASVVEEIFGARVVEFQSFLQQPRHQSTLSSSIPHSALISSPTNLSNPHKDCLL